MRSASLLELGHFAVFEEHHLARVREQRRDIAAAEHLAFADADHERRSVLRYDDSIRLAAGQDRERVTRRALREDRAHRVEQTRGAFRAPGSRGER